jgi:hypothetical protein
MRVNVRRRLRFARLGAGLTAASALAVPLVGTPASADPSGASAPTVSRAVSPAIVRGGLHQIANVASRLCLGGKVTTAIYAAVQSMCAHPGSIGLPVWSLKNVGGNNFQFTSVDFAANDKCLSMGSYTRDGDPVSLEPCSGASSQIFTLIPDPLGRRPASYALQSTLNGKCVAPGGANASSQWVIQWTCDSSSRPFLWNLIPE